MGCGPGITCIDLVRTVALEGGTGAVTESQRPLVRGDLKAVGVVLAALMVLHSRALLGLSAYYEGDIWRWFLPVHSYVRRALLEGSLTPWCDQVSCGYPLWADVQTATLYPPNLLFLIPVPVALVLAWLLWLHYAVAATGMFCLARRLQCSALGSLAAALVFTLSGFMIAHLQHYTIICSAAWLPWAWYALLSYATVPRRGPLALLLWCSAGQILAGHPQMWILTFVSGGLLLLLGVSRQKQRTYLSWLVTGAQGFVAVLLGVALAAVQIVWMLALIGQTIRSESSWDFVTSHSLSPLTALGLIGFEVPVTHRWEFCGFLGAGLLALAISGTLRSRVRAMDWRLWALGLFALVMAFSRYNPVYHFLWRLPLLGSFRCWCRWLLVWSAAVSLIGGLVLTRLQRNELMPRRRWIAVAIPLILAAICATPVVWYATGARLPEGLARLMVDSFVLDRPGRDKPAGYYYAKLPGVLAERSSEIARSPAIYLSLLALGVCAVCMRFAGHLNPRWLACVACAVVVLECFWFGYAYNPVGDADLLRRAPPSASLVRCGGRVLVPPRPQPAVTRQWSARMPDPAAQLADFEQSRQLLFPNINMLFGVSAAGGYMPMELARYHRLRQAASTTDPRFAALLGVQWLVTDLSAGSLPDGWELVAGAGEVLVYRNRLYRGMAWPVFRTEAAERLLPMLRSPSEHRSDLFGVAFLDVPASLPLSAGAEQRGAARVIHSDAGGMSVRCDMASAGLLVITSAWYPGVHARVDGDPAPVMRCNIAFCAVPVPEGNHRVQLAYRPQGLAAGIAVTGAALIIAGFWMLLLPRRQSHVSEHEAL